MERIDVILLQETLGDGISINKIFLKMLLDLDFHSLDVRGRFRGYALGFNNKNIKVDNIWVAKDFWGLTSKPLISIYP